MFGLKASKGSDERRNVEKAQPRLPIIVTICTKSLKIGVKENFLAYNCGDDRLKK